jgi:hypothetical protein
MSRNHRGKRSKLSLEQRNQQQALRWFIKIFAQYEKGERELINTLDDLDNKYFLGESFGVADSAVYPCYAFDGCVLRDAKGQGAWQPHMIIMNDFKVRFYDFEIVR